MKRCGIYAITHTSGARYIGASTHIILRYTNHRFRLRRGIHGSDKLQKLWSSTEETQWKFEILHECTAAELNFYERKFLDECRFLLNSRPNGWHHTEETKRRQSDSRALRLEISPEVRLSLSERAKKQHEDGMFGRSSKGKGRYR